MKNGPDAFERTLRESLDAYEVPYNSADWSQLERELNKGTGLTRSSSAGLLALLLGGTLALATTAYLMINSPEPTGNGRAVAVMSTQPEQAQPRYEQQAQPQTHVVPDQLDAASTKAAPTERATNDAGKPLIPARANASEAPVEPPKSSKPATSEIGIRPSMLEGCPGSQIVFTVDNAPDANEVKGVLWNFGDGSFSVDPTPTHTFTKSGRFEVTLSYSTNKGSLIQKPVTDVIVIHEVPKASFVHLWMGGDEDKVPYMHFEPKSAGAVSYLWDFGDGSTSSLRIPSHVYKAKGTYPVSLVVTNAIGCTDRTERTVTIDEDYNLMAAPAFSPNGDGVDDDFIPDALPKLGLRFQMRVHHPVTGQLLYETNDPKRPWNGRIGGRGEPCPSGNYLWMVEMKDGDKVGGSYTGTVSLVR
ncbi:MAG: PKD domain-containing protein [Flavobacteriales bacterium]|nr:PKD domain-containing protein [Flavobacteriales bacterium]